MMTLLARKTQGATVAIVGTFRDLAGGLADPDEAVLRLKQTDETVAVYRYPTPGAGEGSIVRDSLGTFHVDYALAAGITVVRWEGTGAVADADEDYVYGDPSHIV